MSWEELLIGQSVSVLVQLARDPKGRGRWRKAMLKIFREIARAFRDDEEFAAVMSEVAH